ncbi:MAG: hypothetical protein ICV81_13285, partial [Flavisolibacter sp.]|nr:hypothetical protein [Flavisolibacter sp.]
ISGAVIPFIGFAELNMFRAIGITAGINSGCTILQQAPAPHAHTGQDMGDLFYGLYTLPPPAAVRKVAGSMK